jgi:hypothetical protein
MAFRGSIPTRWERSNMPEQHFGKAREHNRGVRFSVTKVPSAALSQCSSNNSPTANSRPTKSGYEMARIYDREILRPRIGVVYIQDAAGCEDSRRGCTLSTATPYPTTPPRRPACSRISAAASDQAARCIGSKRLRLDERRADPVLY